MQAKAYTAPRLALAGEAAHAIHPIAGQGLNLSLRDVALLAELIADTARLGLDIGAPRLLAAYAARRRGDTARLVLATDVLNRLFSNDLPPVRLLRDAGLAMVEQLPALKKFFMLTAMGTAMSPPRLVRGGGAVMGQFVDLTHTFDDRMPVYPGDPAPIITPGGRLEVDGYNDCCVSTGMHVGTHMDAPLHMIANGEGIATIAPERFIGRGVLVDARGRSEVTAELLNGVKLEAGDIVVVLTGWYKKFRESDYYGPFPEIAADFATRLVEARVSILALDTPSPDRPPFAVHKILLGNGVLIIENLDNVEALLDVKDFTITALPARFDWEAAPVRVIASLFSDLHDRDKYE